MKNKKNMPSFHLNAHLFYQNSAVKVCQSAFDTVSRHFFYSKKICPFLHFFKNTPHVV